MAISSDIKIRVTLTIQNSTYADYIHEEPALKENELQLCTTHGKADSNSTHHDISCHLHKKEFSYYVHKKHHTALYDISVIQTITIDTSLRMMTVLPHPKYMP
jgi:hypothetical protein